MLIKYKHIFLIGYFDHLSLFKKILHLIETFLKHKSIEKKISQHF